MSDKVCNHLTSFLHLYILHHLPHYYDKMPQNSHLTNGRFIKNVVHCDKDSYVVVSVNSMQARVIWEEKTHLKNWIYQSSL